MHVSTRFGSIPRVLAAGYAGAVSCGSVLSGARAAAPLFQPYDAGGFGGPCRGALRLGLFRLRVTHRLDSPFADDDEALAALDAVRCVVEHVGAPQNESPRRSAGDTKARERDRAIQKLQRHSLARVDRRGIGELARREAVLPKPSDCPCEADQNERRPI